MSQYLCSTKYSTRNGTASNLVTRDDRPVTRFLSQRCPDRFAHKAYSVVTVFVIFICNILRCKIYLLRYKEQEAVDRCSTIKSHTGCCCCCCCFFFFFSPADTNTKVSAVRKLAEKALVDRNLLRM